VFLFFVQRINKTVIHPLNNYKVLWDLFICLLVIYCVVVIPLRIGFSLKPSLGPEVFDYFIDCIFFLDMVATFNTAYVDTITETFVYSRAKIARNYLKFWFWIDFFSTIPIDNIVQALAGSSSNLESIHAIRLLRLGRLFKLQRLNKLSEYLEEKMSISPSQIKLVMLILQICFVAHIFACFWHFLALPELSHHQTWLSVERSNGDTAAAYRFATFSNPAKYIASLYYTLVTMLTIGYGDIHPTNDTERVYSIFMMLSGGVVFGALLSKVASVIEKRQPQAKAYKDNMDELRAFLEEYSLPLAVAAKAKVCT
jgi:hypothetical protein